MTSYREVKRRMVADHLPPDFGQKLALKQDHRLADWAAERAGRLRQCGVCDVPISSEFFEEHVATVHTNRKDAKRARALRR